MASQRVKNLARITPRTVGNASVIPVPFTSSSALGKRSRDEESDNPLDVYTSPSKRPMAIPRVPRQAPHCRYPQYDFDGLNSRSSTLGYQNRATQVKPSTPNTQPVAKNARQRRHGSSREHARRAFTDPKIPAIGEEPEDDLSMGIPKLKDPSSRKKKRDATVALNEPSTPSSTVNEATSPQSAKRQRTSSSASSPARSFSDSLASMSPSPKKMEAMKYRASIKRRQLKRASANKEMGDEHVSLWLDDLRTSALRTTSPCLRREIYNTTVKLKKMKVDDADA